MKVYQIGTLVTVTMLTMIGFQNCAKQGSIASQNESSVDSTQMRKSMDDLEVRIKSLSARDLSCSTDADCAMVPVGAAHCGSPTFTVLGSKNSVDYANVVSLAHQFRDIEKSYASSNQLVGTCEAPQYAPPTCVANRCAIAYPNQ